MFATKTLATHTQHARVHSIWSRQLSSPVSKRGRLCSHVAWSAALSHLRRDSDQDLGAIDIFLTPLQALRVDDGVVVLGAPSADSARWIASHLTDALAVLAQSLGAPVGLVRLD